MNRPSRISDGANARAVYNYIGPGRLKQKTLLDGASTVSTYKLLYNGVANITSALYRNSADTATIIGYEHGYDKMGNPSYEIRTHQSSEGDAYMYDDLYRVTRTIYDDSDPTSPTYASARTDDWLLDDIGNRTKIYAKSASATEYEHNAVNEYTSVGGTDYEYDAAGNLTKDDTHYYYWDYENRLTKVELVDGGADVAAYTYDANNRRVEKIVYTADPDETTQYFYDSWSCIEEREDDGTLLATYINGPRIDEYILMNRDSTDCWYMQSPIVGNVAALVDSSGTIQEGYKYRAYGEATVLTGAGNDTTWFTSDDDTATTSAIDNPYTFTGRRLDDETMLMYFRNRMYQFETGAFISRDPIGYTDGMSLYLGYFAPHRVDPFGDYLRWSDEHPGHCKTLLELYREFAVKYGDNFRANRKAMYDAGDEMGDCADLAIDLLYQFTQKYGIVDVELLGTWGIFWPLDAGTGSHVSAQHLYEDNTESAGGIALLKPGDMLIKKGSSDPKHPWWHVQIVDANVVPVMDGNQVRFDVPIIQGNPYKSTVRSWAKSEDSVSQIPGHPTSINSDEAKDLGYTMSWKYEPGVGIEFFEGRKWSGDVLLSATWKDYPAY